MMKLVNKSDLTFRNGLVITADGTVVPIDPKVVEQANDLETMVQQADYLAAQPAASPEPSLDGFKRKSDRDALHNVAFSVSTPLMDAETQRAMRLMEELDSASYGERANELLHGSFGDLLEFVRSEEFVCNDAVEVSKFDTPTLGNPLEFDTLDVMDAIGFICGMKRDGKVSVIVSHDGDVDYEKAKSIAIEECEAIGFDITEGDDDEAGKDDED